MMTGQHIKDFSKTLTEILNSELNLGNEIAEISVGWPGEKTIIVFLKNPFMGSYTTDNVEFREIDDPHYWKSEYYDKLTEDILACGF